MELNNKTNNLTEDEFLVLHKKYRETKDINIRNQLVMNFMYIPKATAVQLRGIVSGYAQIEDMVNQGVISLIDCIERFDVSRGIKFESYAFMRVRGGIIDLVRKQNFVPRRVRSTSKAITETYNQLSNELMREPTQKEIAERMGISVEKLSQYNFESTNAITLSFEELIQNVSQFGDVMDSSSYDDVYPEKNLMKNEIREVLKEGIDSLTEREKLLITLYYYEDLLFADIAKIMDVTPQRVSQLHSRAILKLKSKMDVYMNELA
ncbi:MAG: FliA/WhiG family RNA polymerase sigma factor [Clostridiales bacterium]|nr:FliA/WhiG family RNA polymerase sigma factor [Clostridiales bacterium]